MKIELGKLSGFCAGVKYTVDKAKEVLDKSESDIYCLGEIIHNERVISTLEEKGMITVFDIEEVPDNSKVIFRAHGETKEVYKRALEKNLEVIDLTCAKIRIIRNKMESVIDDSFIVIIGKKNHPETIGTLSFAGPNSFVVEDVDDINELVKLVKDSQKNKIYINAQTTFSSIEFDNLVEKIKDSFNENFEIEINKSICNATEDRQKETMELSKMVDKMIIIGGKNSSNTKELYKIAVDNCKYALLVQEARDLNEYSFSRDEVIGIMAGASTPKSVIDEIIGYLNNIK